MLHMYIYMKPRKGLKPCLTFYPTYDWELAFHIYIERERAHQSLWKLNYVRSTSGKLPIVQITGVRSKGGCQVAALLKFWSGWLYTRLLHAQSSIQSFFSLVPRSWKTETRIYLPLKKFLYTTLQIELVSTSVSSTRKAILSPEWKSSFHPLRK